MPNAALDEVTRPTAASFADAVATLIGRPLRPDEIIAVAVSGGPDSLALLWLAHSAFGARVRAITVDHNLRPEAKGEAVLVAECAAMLGVAHDVLCWDGDKPIGNLQAAARHARYALMQQFCATNGIRWLATAHHRDDAAETLLLRLARGSGVGGLGGIRPSRDLGGGVTVLRPLLTATKTDLAAIVSVAGWTAVDDPTNRAARFDRTRARATLRSTSWLDAARLAASAAHLADADAALTWAEDLAWRGRVERDGDELIVDAAGLPHELRRRLLRRAVTTLVPAAVFRGDGVERTLHHLASGSGGTVAGVAIRPVMMAGVWMWRLRQAPGRGLSPKMRPDAADSRLTAAG